MIRLRNLALVVAGTLLAAEAHADRAADLAAMEKFQLTDSLLEKYQAVQTDANKDVCHLSPLVAMNMGDEDAKQMSLDEFASRYDAKPGVHAMLARHDLAARDMALVMFTLTAGAMHDMPDMPGMSKGSVPPISASNLAFYEAHKASLLQFQTKLGKELMKETGGQPPSCMMR